MKVGTRVFLAVSGAATFAVMTPLVVNPVAWARVTGWDPPSTPLEDYLARSLGALGFALAATTSLAALASRSPRSLIGLLAAIGGGAVAVHVRGALRGTYPAREAAEVPFIALWTLWAAHALRRERS